MLVRREALKRRASSKLILGRERGRGRRSQCSVRRYVNKYPCGEVGFERDYHNASILHFQ